MILYVNGDSHSAGAELVQDFCFADDDPEFRHLGRRPHPQAIPFTYGYQLAKTLNAGFYLDAESGSSNSRIMRTTRVFLSEKRNQDVIVVIGWSTFEREEWSHQGSVYQVTASGTDIVPEDLGQKYKYWVTQQTEKELHRKTAYWHQQIWDLHSELVDRNIRHIFFNTYLHFDDVAVPESARNNWNGCFLDPYDRTGTYYYTLQEQGFKTVGEHSYHYGRDAQIYWCNHLLKRLTNINVDSKLRQVTVKSNVVKYKRHSNDDISTG